MAWTGIAEDPTTGKLAVADLPDTHRKGQPGGIPGLDADGNVTGVNGAPISVGGGTGGGSVVFVEYDTVAGAWPAYSTNPAIIRIFGSPADVVAPVHHNRYDMWNRQPL